MRQIIFIRIILFSILLTTGANKLFAQEVEHNYKVGPQVTTCDSLNLKSVPSDLRLKTVRKTKFRFRQSFKLTRQKGFQSGEYFSCDNISGYLILKYNGVEMLYHEVKKEIWKALISSSDPEGYYLGIKEDLQEF